MTSEDAIKILQDKAETAQFTANYIELEAFRIAIRALKGNTCNNRQGKWIAREDMNYLDENKIIHEHFMCDRCGLIHDFIDGHTTQYKYCPNCGADMRGDV